MEKIKVIVGKNQTLSESILKEINDRGYEIEIVDHIVGVDKKDAVLVTSGNLEDILINKDRYCSPSIVDMNTIHEFHKLRSDFEDFEYSHLTKKEREANILPIRTTPKIGRNEPCSCGSGKKNKHCCKIL